MARIKNIALAVGSSSLFAWLTSDIYKLGGHIIIDDRINTESFDLSLLPPLAYKAPVHRPYGKRYRNMPVKY